MGSDFSKLNEREQLARSVEMIGEEFNNQLRKIVVRGKSNIHGHGLFALNEIKKGRILGVSMVIFSKDKPDEAALRTMAGKWINHDLDPNCRVVMGEEDCVLLESIKTISSNEELTLDYNQVKSLIDFEIEIP